MPKLRQEVIALSEIGLVTVQAESDMDRETFSLHIKLRHNRGTDYVSSSDRITHEWEHEWPLDHVHLLPVRSEVEQ